MNRIFRNLMLTGALASGIFGCDKGDSSGTQSTHNTAGQKSRLEEAEKILSGLDKSTTYVPTTPATVSTSPKTGTQPSVPTTPGTTTVLTGPKPVLPGPVTPGQPSVPSVTNGSERKQRNKLSRMALRSNILKQSEKSSLGYFSVTEPQNFVGVMGYGRLQSPKLGDLSLDGYGAAGIVNLDVRPFSFLRTEVSGSYAEDVAKRIGKDSITNIGLARVGGEVVLADNKDFYLSLGPLVGFNSIRNKEAVGFEPSELDALSVGGKARVSLKNLGLEAYISGLQSVEGKHKTSEGLEFDYSVRDLKAGLKQHLGKGVSVGVEGSDIFQETKDVTRFWIRSGTGYVELKDFVNGLSAWGILTGRDIDAPGKQRANELEGRLRFLADLGYGIHFGVGGSYSFSKVQGIKGSNNYSLDALIAFKFD